MLHVELDFLPAERDADVAIVIDVLRMTTTATAMLAHGYREVIVVAEVDEARRVARSTRSGLFGERHGVALPDSTGGNSPLEHVGREIGGGLATSSAVLCTTNGSRAVGSARADHLLLGAIVNAAATARRAVALATRGIELVCAGTDGRPSLDDVVAAASILRALEATGRALSLSDACRMALDVAAAAPDPASGLQRARHAATLVELGFEDDVAFAGELDRFDVVPERQAGERATFRAAPARA